jgi:hypothetical protein
MNLTSLIIQLISGAVGGNVAGSVLSKFNLGPVGNSVAGILGGGLGGQLISMLTGGAAPGATAAGFDLSSILANVGGGGIGGAILMIVVGLIKVKMSKAPS